jgi:hypothetical protein
MIDSAATDSGEMLRRRFRFGIVSYLAIISQESSSVPSGPLLEVLTRCTIHPKMIMHKEELTMAIIQGEGGDTGRVERISEREWVFLVFTGLTSLPGYIMLLMYGVARLLYAILGSSYTFVDWLQSLDLRTGIAPFSKVFGMAFYFLSFLGVFACPVVQLRC